MPRKILFVNNDITYFLLHRKKFYNYFVSIGYDVHLLFPKSEKKYQDKLEKIHNVYFFSYSRKNINILKEFFSFFKFLFILIQIKPSIIYVTTFKMNIYAYVCSLISSSNFILNYSGLGRLYISFNIIHRFLKTVLEIIFRYCFYYKTNCINIFENQDDLNYFTNNKLLNIQYCYKQNGVGVDTNFFYPSRRNLNNKINLIMVSRITKEKGVNEYLNIANLFLDSDQFNFYLIGKYEKINNEDDLFELVNKMHKEKAIIYVPWTSNIKHYYDKAHISVLLSYREGMSAFLMESLASGLPIICSNIPSNTEIVKENKNGFLVEAKFSQNIKNIIYQLVENKSVYSSFSKYSRQRAIDNFSEDIIMTNFNDIVKEII